MPPNRGDVLDKISALNEGDEGVDAGDVRDTISDFNEANEGKRNFRPTDVSEAEPPDIEVAGEYGVEKPGPTNTPDGQDVMDPSPDTEEVVGEYGVQEPEVTAPDVTNNTDPTNKGPTGTTSGTSPVVGKDIGRTPDNTIGITSTDPSIDGSMGTGLDPKLIIGAVAVALLAFAR